LEKPAETPVAVQTALCVLQCSGTHQQTWRLFSRGFQAFQSSTV
jgi:hypothetical protein